MSDTAAPVAENKVEVPAVVEEATPADVPKAEETTVSPKHYCVLAFSLLIITMEEAPKVAATAEEAPATEATPAAEDATATPAEEAKPVS